MTTRNSLEDQISKRQESNREIIRKISEMVEAYPDLRFHQILQNLRINQTKYSKKPDGSTNYEDGHLADLFYEESVVTLKRMSPQEPEQQN